MTIIYLTTEKGKDVEKVVRDVIHINNRFGECRITQDGKTEILVIPINSIQDIF